MDAMTWWKLVGTEQAKAAVLSTGTSWLYFQHIAHKRKRPGPDLARRLINASGGALTLDELLFPEDQRRSPGQVVKPDVGEGIA